MADEILYRELELRVYYDYYPPSKGARERGSGVQLEPDEPASLEVTQVQCYSHTDEHGKRRYKVIDLPDAIVQDMEIELMEIANAEPDGGY